jgi:hypothetical protein
VQEEGEGGVNRGCLVRLSHASTWARADDQQLTWEVMGVVRRGMGLVMGVVGRGMGLEAEVGNLHSSSPREAESAAPGKASSSAYMPKLQAGQCSAS